MSRSQRICNSQRKQTQQIRHILMQGSTYYKIQHVPVEKVVLGNADPTRWPATLHSYLRHTLCLTLSPETSTVLCLVMISGIWSMLCQVMLWIMMISLQKMFTPFATKSILSSTTMIDTYNFTGDGVTLLGLVGVISTGIIIVTAFRRYYSSPMRK